MVTHIFQLCELDSVAQFAKELAERHPRIDYLVNNAGTSPMVGARTPDGLESGFGCMHLGHFTLTVELLPKLRASAPGVRIVNVASHAGVGAAQQAHLAHSVGGEGDAWWSEYARGWGAFDPSFYVGDGEGDLRGEKTDGGFPAYARAKLSNILTA